LGDEATFQQSDFELVKPHDCVPETDISNRDAVTADAKTASRQNLHLGGKRVALNAAKFL
jgi:hypothetical protein